MTPKQYRESFLTVVIVILVIMAFFVLCLFFLVGCTPKPVPAKAPGPTTLVETGPPPVPMMLTPKPRPRLFAMSAAPPPTNPPARVVPIRMPANAPPFKYWLVEETTDAVHWSVTQSNGLGAIVPKDLTVTNTGGLLRLVRIHGVTY